MYGHRELGDIWFIQIHCLRFFTSNLDMYFIFQELLEFFSLCFFLVKKTDVYYQICTRKLAVI